MKDLTCHKKAVDKESQKFTALCHSSRHNGGGGGCKAILEEELCVLDVRRVGQGEVPSLVADELVSLTKGKCIAEKPVGYTCHN